MNDDTYKEVEQFIKGKSDATLALFDHFLQTYHSIGPVTVHSAKTMIGIANPKKRIAWITYLGKNFVHVVFPFKKPYLDNLCFTKIARVPGDVCQFNHHFRMYDRDDVNEEVIQFMKLAFGGEINNG